jgi:hypothetical protein
MALAPFGQNSINSEYHKGLRSPTTAHGAFFLPDEALFYQGRFYVRNSCRPCENSASAQPRPEFRGLWWRGQQKIAKNHPPRGHTETKIEFSHGLLDLCTRVCFQQQF